MLDLLDRQHGAIATRQLREIGIAPATVDAWKHEGRLFANTEESGRTRSA